MSIPRRFVPFAWAAAAVAVFAGVALFRPAGRDAGSLRADLGALRSALPTDRWDEQRRGGAIRFTEAAIADGRKALLRFLDDLSARPDDRAAAYAAVRAAVERFNDLNRVHPGFIETGEREELCDFFRKAADALELEYEDGDITLPWRTFW